jgi:CubicO group peptidase (beta-lactamase class C family)
MRISRLAVLAAAVLMTSPALAQAPSQTPAQPAPSADPGVLFWTPERRETDFRRMETVTPHARVPASSTPRLLPEGAALDLDVDAFMQAERTAGLLVLQDGKVRFERYGLGMTPSDHWDSFSVTKSLTSTLVGAAIRDGFISGLDAPLTDYLPEMAGSGYDGVTVRQLLTMTSGVDWNEDYADPASDVARLFLTPADPGLDATVSYMRRLGRAAEPGTRWHYNTGETNLAGVLVARATGRPLSQYLSEEIWTPAGMADPAFWMLDEQGREAGGCCLSATLRDWGRVGLMALEKGRTPSGPIVGDDWFDQATRTQADIGAPGRGYGFQWWTADDGAFDGRGIFGQTLHVDRERRLVVVILSAWPTAVGSERSAARAALLARIGAAVDAAPQP